MDRLIEVDLKGCFLCAQAAAKRMIQQGEGGSIINISSNAGTRAYVPRAGYASAKAGLNMLTRQLAIELGPHNIRVNAISPGLVKTEMSRFIWDDPEMSKQVIASVPMGRWGEAIDVAATALFLASNASSYISGVILPVDGGRSAS